MPLRISIQKKPILIHLYQNTFEKKLSLLLNIDDKSVRTVLASLDNPKFLWSVEKCKIVIYEHLVTFL